jgi:hypothetical protein
MQIMESTPFGLCPIGAARVLRLSTMSVTIYHMKIRHITRKKVKKTALSTPLHIEAPIAQRCVDVRRADSC